MTKLRLLAALAALATILAACTPTPTVVQPDGSGLESRARAAEQQGDLREAARLYRSLADMNGGSVRAGYLVDAARVSIAMNDTTDAAAWLREAEGAATDAQHQAIVALLADIDVREDRAANALARLGQLREPMPMDVLIHAEGVRGRALFRLGRAAEAVRTLVERETWLETADDILANQRMIWDGLAADGGTTRARTGDQIVDGWLALAPLAASGAQGAELRGALIDWRREYAGHPAAAGLLADLLRDERGDRAYPAQVALLLPITSPQRTSAIAIRDGFLAAHLASRAGAGRGDDVSIRVYDTGLLGAAEAYQRAQLEGAEFIVGPLLRPEVDAIIEQAGFVPTLALNFVDADTSLVDGFYQFALAYEDEARAIARRAIADGARTAIALVPSDDWGYRLLNSFRAEFEALGGRLLGFNGYDESAQDFSAPIESLLNLDRSEQRHRRLAANLNVPLAFEPRRRQDADMIFLATPRRSVARLLAPALRFHFAGDLPTYATTDIHEPSNTGRDGDLNDIYFPDAPWVLRPDPQSAELRSTLQSFWPNRAASNLRLYGMGVDAYRLVGALYSGNTAWPLDGLTGALELDVSGRVHRSLSFAQFRNGRPIALEPIEQPPRTRPQPQDEIFGAR